MSAVRRAGRGAAAFLLAGSIVVAAVLAGVLLQRMGGLHGVVRQAPPVTVGSAAAAAHQAHDHHAAAGAPAEPDAGPGQGGGLAVASDSYVLAPAVTRFQSGRTGTFSFRILDRSARPVTSFTREHTKLLHLIVVRRDLTGYQHLHPSLGAGGTWSTRLTLPQAGAYRAFTDFVTGTGAQTLGVDLFAAGRFQAAALPAPSATAAVAGYQVALHAAPARAGSAGELTFQVSRDGWTVADLEPYLGARGHLVALREGDLAYLHVHPQDAATSGSTIRFHATFPSAGTYRLFLQFQHAGQVRTAGFTVKIQ